MTYFIILLGLVAIVAGAYLIHPGLALVAFGAGCLRAAAVLDRSDS